MANTILTPTAVTRSCLAVLHQKLNFIGTINRQYDDSFAKEGAKIGSALKIRLPNQYTVGTGSTLSTQDTTEISTTLNVTSRKHVDLKFTDNDLTLSLQDFEDRIVTPAISVLAANIEADALNMHKDVYNCIDNSATSLTLRQILDAGVKLDLDLTPMDNRRTALLRPQDQADLVNQLKGLFQDSKEISRQYREGRMGRTAGFDFLANTLFPTTTSGTTSVTNNQTINTTISASADTGVATLDIINNTGPHGTWKAGDVFTIAGLNKVHGESKADLGVLQQFVITADVAAGSATSIPFAPAIYMTGGRQNVVSTAISAAAVAKVGTPSYVYKPSMVYHEDAFTFATADLVKPNGVHFAGREVKDGISMLLVKQYDINYATFPCRVDVLYGYKTIRPAMACRILSN